MMQQLASRPCTKASLRVSWHRLSWSSNYCYLSTRHVRSSVTAWCRRLHSAGLVSKGATVYLTGRGTEALKSLPTVEEQAQDSQAAGVEFDWKLAVALGGCSFEAYNDPENDVQDSSNLGEVSPSGSRVVYADKKFLLEKMKGLLEVTVSSAANLPVADMWPGTSDPYCILQIGESSCTTSVINNNLNPVWDESYFLFIRDPMKQRMLMRVLDRDIGKRDDFLGSSVRQLRDLCDGEQHSLTLALEGPQGPAGQLHLKTQFLPFDTMLADEADSGKMGGPAGGPPGRSLLAHMPAMHLQTGKESPWKELQHLAGITVHSMFTPLCFIENLTTDAQAWVFWNYKARQVCVAFRGTEQDKWRDLLVDIYLVPSAFNPDRVADAPRTAALAEQSKEPSLLEKVVGQVQSAREEAQAQREQKRQQAEQQDATPEEKQLVADTEAEGGVLQASLNVVQETAQDLTKILDQIKHIIQQAQEQGEEGEGTQPWVHQGFLSAYDSIRPQVLSIIEILLDQRGASQEGEGERRRPWAVYLTGHSLGGALATLCAYDVAARTAQEDARPSLALYNFGSPRVGNKAFAQEFNRLVPNTWRVVNGDDAVCTVPRLMGYCHVGHAVKLRKGGEVDIQRDTSDVLGEGIAIPEVLPVALPKLTEKVLEKLGVEVALAASGVKEDASEHDATAAELASAPASPTLSSTQVEDLLEQEMEAWSLLLSGNSLNQHMEDGVGGYLESLRTFAEAMAMEKGLEGSQQ